MFFKSLFHKKITFFKSGTKTTPYTRGYDKRVESDRQMLQRVAIRFALLFVVILMFDTLLDWFLGLLDFIIHLAHLGIEAIEYMLELFLESTFDTSAQQSEVIIVNGTIVIALFMTYRLIKAFPSWCVRRKRNFRAAWLRFLRRESSCWRAMSLSYRIKWLGAYCLGTSCLLFIIS